MPSPIAHFAAGYTLYRILRERLPRLTETLPAFFLFAAASVLSVLPDIDCVAGVVSGDFARFHNNITHSFAAGVAVALLVAGLAALPKREGTAVAWFVFVLAFYSLHVVMDYFTAGRGVMAFWPLLANRFESPVCIFRGVKWASGVWSIEHLWTFLNELLFVCALVLLTFLIGRRHRTITSR